MEYHDQNPPLQNIQDLFPRMALNPAGKKPFNKILSVRGAKVSVDAMIIANHRAKNLEDLFSIRNIKKTAPPSLILPLDKLGGYVCSHSQISKVSVSNLV